MTIKPITKQAFTCSAAVEELPHEYNYNQLLSADYNYSSITASNNSIAVTTQTTTHQLAKDDATLDKIIQQVMIEIEGKG